MSTVFLCAIDRPEYGRDIAALDNELKTLAPTDVQFAEITVRDFENFMSIWDSALPEERASLLASMSEKLYVNFDTGQLLEMVPKSGFRYVLEAASLTRPLGGSG